METRKYIAILTVEFAIFAIGSLSWASEIKVSFSLNTDFAVGIVTRQIKP